MSASGQCWKMRTHIAAETGKSQLFRLPAQSRKPPARTHKTAPLSLPLPRKIGKGFPAPGEACSTLRRLERRRSLEYNGQSPPGRGKNVFWEFVVGPFRRCTSENYPHYLVNVVTPPFYRRNFSISNSGRSGFANSSKL